MEPKRKNENQYEVFCAEFKCEPSDRHPFYYDTQVGMLYVWLLAKDLEAAGTKASQIFEALPYKYIDSRVVVTGADTPEPGPDLLRCRKQAEQVGLAVFFLRLEIGEDEAKFFAKWPEK